MDAGVPFALVAAVQVVAFAAALGLAAAGAVAASRMPARVLLALGGVALAAAHALTGAELGPAASDELALLRGLGYVLLAGGLADVRALPLPVVVPLGAGVPAAAASAVAALAAGASALRVRRPGRRLLVAAAVVAAGAEALAPAAGRTASAALAVLGLRGVWALLAVGFVARVAQTRLLAKVVGAILAGVLLLAVGTAVVVGSVATASLARDTALTLRQVAEGQVEGFRDTADVAQGLAGVVSICAPDCGEVLREFTADPDPITATVRSGGRVPAGYTGLSTIEVHDLAQSDVVAEVFRTGAPAATLDVVLGGEVKLVAIGVTPRRGAPARRAVDTVYVYGSTLGADRVARIEAETDFAATLFVGERTVASSIERPAARQRIEAEYVRRDVAAALAGGREGVTVPAEGERPAVRFQALRNARGDLVGVLALSAESNVVLGTQRSVLRALFVGTLAVALLVGLFAIALGRRLVRPVQQLTLAAARVRRGDLAVRTALPAHDELGALSRSFDAMTESLQRSTDDLVRAAADETALRARLQAVLDSMGDGLVTTDATGVVTTVNPAAERMLERSAAELVGRPVTDVLDGVDGSGTPLLADLAAAPGVRVGVVHAASGRVVPVALALTRLAGGEGHVVVVRDTTREREVERMKTEFLSNVSHELRTPLTPIRGYAEILRRHPNLPREKTEQYAGSILESSARMGRVVDLLVDVAALEAGRVVPSMAAVDVGEFVAERIEAWRRRAPEREFRRRVAAGLPAVLVDAVWVGKAFDELVDNAVKYSGGPITIAAAPAPDGRVRLTVRDTGAGIPPEDRDRLFAPFAQVDGSATRSVGGLGLGLSFVRRVAEGFDLDVVVESVVGKGSAFSLDCPVADAPPRHRPARRGRAATRPRGTTAPGARQRRLR